jgi:hypothetical protein
VADLSSDTGQSLLLLYSDPELTREQHEENLKAIMKSSYNTFYPDLGYSYKEPDYVSHETQKARTENSSFLSDIKHRLSKSTSAKVFAIL